jgi:hypothetical protein
MKKLTLLLAFLPFCVWAQTNWKDYSLEEGKHYSIQITGEKETITGEYVEKNDNVLVLKTRVIERIEIKWSNIKSIEPMDAKSIKNNDYYFKNVGTSRYYISSSGYGLGKDQWEYRNHYLFLNSFHGGITDQLQVSAGFEFMSLFAVGDPFIFLSTSYRFKLTDNFRVGTGITYMGLPSATEDNVILPALTATYGSPDHHASFTIGKPLNKYISDEYYWAISAQTRVSKRLALITDNFRFPTDGEGIFTYGLRFLGEKSAIDLGFINNEFISEAIFIGYPFVGFSVRL